jgi:hypothetical protein
MKAKLCFVPASAIGSSKEIQSKQVNISALIWIWIANEAIADVIQKGITRLWGSGSLGSSP